MATDFVGKKLVELPGQSLVASEVAKKGFVPLLTPQGFKSVDIIAFHARTLRTVPVQVKTRNGGYQFPMSRGTRKKPENVLYVFVRLTPDNCDDFFVVPGRRINRLLAICRKRYKQGHPGSRANPEKQAWSLDARIDLAPYRNAWGHLTRPPRR